MKTSELEGVMLDYAVAKCELMVGQDYTLAIDTDFDGTKRVNFGGTYPEWSTDWQEAGPIIEREKMRIAYNFDEHIWEAGWDCHVKGWGDTPLIAAMRCYVVDQLGDEIQFLKNEEEVK